MKSNAKQNTWRLGLVAVVVFVIIFYWKSIDAGMRNIVSAFVPLIIGAVIAYIINITMAFYERHFFPKHQGKKMHTFRRAFCMIAAIVTILAIFAGVISLIIPQLVESIKQLAASAPVLVDNLLSNQYVIKFFPKITGLNLENYDWNALLEKGKDYVVNGVTEHSKTIMSTVTSSVSIVTSIVLGIVFSIYMLAGKEKILRFFRRFNERIFSEKVMKKLDYYGGVLNDSFHNFFVGQTVEAFILGSLCSLGMVCLRLPYASMIGPLVGITAFIPVVGALIGAAVGALIILAVSPMKAIIFLVFLIILQQVEGKLIYPHVVGKMIETPGILILTAVFVGGSLSGLFGIVLGVPLIAALYKIVKDDLTEYYSKHPEPLKYRKQKKQDPDKKDGENPEPVLVSADSFRVRSNDSDSSFPTS